MEETRFDSICRSGKLVNEDIVYVSKSMGWVLDAATGLSNNKFTSAGTDGAWFVDKWNSYLKDHLGDLDKSIKEVVEKGISIVKEGFYTEANITEIDPISIPSSSLVIARINENTLEYFLLGDCTLLIKFRDGLTKRIKDTRVEVLDNEALKEMHQVRQEKSLSFEEAREYINPKLMRNRLLNNKPNGYWTLQFEKESANNGIEGQLDIDDISQLLMMSDGYASIYDVYHNCTENELVDQVNSNGLELIYNKIRNIEEEDTDCSKFPRFKKGDDASAVYFNFE